MRNSQVLCSCFLLFSMLKKNLFLICSMSKNWHSLFNWSVQAFNDWAYLYKRIWIVDKFDLSRMSAVHMKVKETHSLFRHSCLNISSLCNSPSPSSPGRNSCNSFFYTTTHYTYFLKISKTYFTMAFDDSLSSSSSSTSCSTRSVDYLFNVLIDYSSDFSASTFS